MIAGPRPGHVVGLAALALIVGFVVDVATGGALSEATRTISDRDIVGLFVDYRVGIGP